MALSRTSKKEEETQMAVDAPVPHIAMPDSLSSSPLSPALNPAFDEQMIQETMPAPENVVEPQVEESENAEEEEEESKYPPQGADPEVDTGLQRAFTLLEDSVSDESSDKMSQK
ncbi:hypothetical protein A8A01_10595 [Ewingella americana]|nr:hypothetical protein A8A01_10595 [Ewingella americana]